MPSTSTAPSAQAQLSRIYGYQVHPGIRHCKSPWLSAFAVITSHITAGSAQPTWSKHGACCLFSLLSQCSLHPRSTSLGKWVPWFTSKLGELWVRTVIAITRNNQGVHPLREREVSQALQRLSCEISQDKVCILFLSYQWMTSDSQPWMNAWTAWHWKDCPLLGDRAK